MDRVVTALEDGGIKVDDGVFGTVNYLIFEPADGDIRRHLALPQRVEIAWILRSLHHIATGLLQLHSSKVAHQDVKPSNVLVFDRKISKVSDLGSASIKETDLLPEMMQHLQEIVPMPHRNCCMGKETMSGIAADGHPMSII